MSATRMSLKGINPRLRWQYERDDAFNRAAARVARLFLTSAVLALLLRVVAA